MLGRVPAASILDRTAYQFWNGGSSRSDRVVGRGGSGRSSGTFGGSSSSGGDRSVGGGGGTDAVVASWSSSAADAAPHFEYTHMTGQVHTFYNAGLKRYIIPNYGFM